MASFSENFEEFCGRMEGELILSSFFFLKFLLSATETIDYKNIYSSNIVAITIATLGSLLLSFIEFSIDHTTILSTEEIKIIINDVHHRESPGRHTLKYWSYSGRADTILRTKLMPQDKYYPPALLRSKYTVHFAAIWSIFIENSQVL